MKFSMILKKVASAFDSMGYARFASQLNCRLSGQQQETTEIAAKQRW
jgi:hypothetical protein